MLDTTLKTMELTLNTPALLFPTVSLLYIGYTNRFFAIATLIRTLRKRYHEEHDDVVLKQITNLRRRLNMIRNMQLFGILALLFCMICMILIYTGNQPEAKVSFAFSLLLLTTSLFFSLREIHFSIHAIDLDLKSIEDDIRKSEKEDRK